jgi:hypothetical protein
VTDIKRVLAMHVFVEASAKGSDTTLTGINHGCTVEVNEKAPEKTLYPKEEIE